LQKTWNLFLGDRIEAIETLKNLGKLQVQGLSQEEHSYSSYGSNMTGAFNYFQPNCVKKQVASFKNRHEDMNEESSISC